MADAKTITLGGGPGHGQVFFVEEFRDFIRATQRMNHTTPAGAGWALGYAPGGTTLGGGPLWTWQGVNCHPADPNDPELAPYGAAFAAEFHRSSRHAA
jgi:hypothetical protein